MTIGMTARSRGQLEEALGSLQEAMAMAERDDDAHRRSGALYQLSTLYLVLKQPQNALDASRQAYRFAELAGKHARHGQGANGGIRGARSARRPGAGTGGDGRGPCPRPQVALGGRREPRAHQSRRHHGCGAGNSTTPWTSRASRLRSRPRVQRRRAAIATSKANIGFALFGLGRAAEGKRLRRRGARRIRAHRRDRRNRRRCSASTASISSAPGTTRPRWRSSIGRTAAR